MAIESSKFIGIIHWPRLWMVLAPSMLSGEFSTKFDPNTLADEVWAGGSTIPMKTLRDGTILFDLSSYLDGKLAPLNFAPPSVAGARYDIAGLDEERCELINTYLLCLYAKLRECQKQVVEMTIARSKSLVIQSDNIINTKQDQITIALSHAKFSSQYLINLPVGMDWRVQTHPGNCVHLETLGEASALYESILANEDVEHIKRLSSLLLRAYVEAEQHNYRLSASHAAMVCEFVLKLKLAEPNARSKFFNWIKDSKDDCDVPICQACRSNIEVTGQNCNSGEDEEDSNGQITCVNRVRCTRNDWLHNQTKIPKARAKEALRAATMLISTLIGSDFSIEVSDTIAVW